MRFGNSGESTVASVAMHTLPSIVYVSNVEKMSICASFKRVFNPRLPVLKQTKIKHQEDET
jgi:hypothetical protein